MRWYVVEPPSHPRKNHEWKDWTHIQMNFLLVVDNLQFVTSEEAQIVSFHLLEIIQCFDYLWSLWKEQIRKESELID